MNPLNQAVLGLPWWKYWALALLLSAVVRIVLTLFRVFRHAHESGSSATSVWCYFARTLIGLGKEVDFSTLKTEEEKERVRGDYGTAYVLGVLELVAYPFLFAAGLNAYVGAWIGLKVVVQYKHWTEDRGSFTAFLIGNALVLMFAFVILQGYVSRSHRV